MNPIYLRHSGYQPKSHIVFIGPNRIKRHIKYKIKYRIINNKIFVSSKHTDILLDFILDNKLNLVLGQYHLYLSNNNDYVYAAGRIKVDNFGYISYLDNWSGHYRPTDLDFINFSEYFKKHFQTTHDCQFNFIDN